MQYLQNSYLHFLHYISGRSCYSSEGKFLFCTRRNGRESYIFRRKKKFEKRRKKFGQARTVDSQTGTIMESKEMAQEILNIPISHQNTFQSISLPKYPNKFFIT